jgi:hypothetical protein
LKSSPQEGERLKIPPGLLEQTLSYLAKFVQSRPAKLVFNLDEIRISDWGDRKRKTLLVPRVMAEQAGHHKVNQRLKHVCDITWVSAAGDSLMPSVVTFQRILKS